jgi:hypothetical protein
MFLLHVSDLYKVIIRKVYTNAYKYSKFCQRCACVDFMVDH